MSFPVSNRIQSKLLLIAYVLGVILLTVAAVALLHWCWQFVRISIDVSILAAGQHIQSVY